MKIKYIILLAVIVMTSTMSLKRTETERTETETETEKTQTETLKTERTKFKSTAKLFNEGSGSYQEGFNCPRFKVTFNGKEVVEAKDVTFFPVQIEKHATAPHNLGMAFKMGQPAGVLARFMFKEGDFWYIPFRFMTSQWTYVNPWGTNKRLSGWAINDQGESALLTLDLPYKTFGWFINDDEGNKIAGRLNHWATFHQSVVRTAKVGATAAAANYNSAAPLVTAAAGDEAKLKQELIKQEENLAKLQTEVNNFKKNAEVLSKEIGTLKGDLVAKETQFSTLQSKINSMSSDANSINKNLQSLKTDNSTAAEKKEKFGAIADAALKGLKTSLANLRTEAPPRKVNIDAAEAAVKSLNNKEFVNNLSKVTPL